MKLLKTYLVIFCLFFVTGCATTGGIKTANQRKIDKTEEQINEDAKDLLAVAKNVLDKVKSTDPEFAKAMDIMKKAQVLLGTTIQDTEQFNKLSNDKLDQVVNDIYEKNLSLQNEIKELKDKDDEFTSKILTENIELEAIKRHERAKSIKFFAVCGTILAILGSLVYFFPSQALRVGSSILGIFKK